MAPTRQRMWAQFAKFWATYAGVIGAEIWPWSPVERHGHVNNPRNTKAPCQLSRRFVRQQEAVPWPLGRAFGSPHNSLSRVTMCSVQRTSVKLRFRHGSIRSVPIHKHIWQAGLPLELESCGKSSINGQRACILHTLLRYIALSTTKEEL